MVTLTEYIKKKINQGFVLEDLLKDKKLLQHFWYNENQLALKYKKVQQELMQEANKPIAEQPATPRREQRTRFVGVRLRVDLFNKIRDWNISRTINEALQQYLKPKTDNQQNIN